MEEWVGAVWDRLITRAATREYPAAAVSLMQMEKTLGIVFRGLGGDPGLRLQQAVAKRHGARRSWLARIAGSADKTPFAGINGTSLDLPERIALFSDTTLNRDLYLWLAALAAHDVPDDEWIVRNQRATVITLARFPGLERRYRRLVAACISQRSDPAGMPQDEAEQECAIRAALNEPGAVAQLPPLHRRGAKALQAVPLWL